MGLHYAVVVHGAELVLPGAAPVLGKRLARAVHGADLVLPVSSYTSGQVTRLLRRHRLPVPPTAIARAGVDLDRFTPDVATSEVRARYSIPPERKIVLCLGRLVPRKGVDRVVRAMPRIAERVPDAVLLVAGTGPQERKLRRLAAASRAPVLFLGAVPDPDIPALYNMADVYVLAVADRWAGLEAEGLGIVLLEASSCATPVVTGRSGGTPEAIVHGETGFVVDARNETELTDRIVKLLEDPAEAERMGAMGRAHVGQSFSGQPPDELVDWLDGNLGR